MKKFIRDDDHIIHISGDNWKTFESLKNHIEEGEEEKNSDVIFRVKLRFKLKEIKASIIINELDGIRKEFGLQENDGYGHPLEIFAISVIHNIDYATVYNKYIVKGNFDGKIDAIYWNGDTNYVYQIKNGMYNSNDIDIMKNNYKEYTRNRTITSSDSRDLLDFCNEHSNEIVLNKHREFRVITASPGREQFKSIDDIYDDYFRSELLNRKNNIKLVLEIPEKNNCTCLSEDGSMYAYIVSAKKFISDILKCENISNQIDNMYKLFYDNVRGFLGENDSMTKTIENEPKNFIKYNNGVTITGKINKLNDECFEIIEPIINNGQQTVMNLANKYPNIDDVNLLIIVKNESDDKVKSKISEYTNTQRSIKPIDLLSISSNVRELQEKVYEKTKNEEQFFIEINNSGSRHHDKIVKKIYKKENIIKLIDFIRLLKTVESSGKKLGDWKNNVSTQIKEVLKSEDSYDVDDAISICKTISEYNDYIKTIHDKKIVNDLKTGDLAFMYIKYKYGFDSLKTHEILNRINEKYYYGLLPKERPSKLIDIYKVNSIIDKIQKEIENS